MIHYLSAHEALMLLRTHEAILLDVRESHEYLQEHIPYALSLPISQHTRWLHWIAAQSPSIWIIQCLKGMRSEQFAHMLKSARIPSADRIYVLDGGLNRWISAGLETVKGYLPEDHSCGIYHKKYCPCPESDCCNDCCQSPSQPCAEPCKVDKGCGCATPSCCWSCCTSSPKDNCPGNCKSEQKCVCPPASCCKSCCKDSDDVKGACKH